MPRVPIKRVDDDNRRIYDCPICHTGEVAVPDNLFYGRCDNCEATLIDYIPLQHQEDFHNSTAQYRMNIGGFGSGKTTAACAEVAQHAMETPNGKTLITAPTLSLVKDAVIPELDKFLPTWYVTKVRTNPSPYYKLKNGHEIIVYSSADQQKVRSLNLTAFYIEEASGVPYSMFDVLMTRLRHKAGVIKDEDGNEVAYKFMGILSTNPEDGWIQDKFLLISKVLKASPSVDLLAYDHLRKDKLDRHFHTFISSTRDNNNVPDEFIERMSAGKSARWIRKYVDCILDIRDGAVYPDFNKNIVEPFKIPDHWKIIAGYDPGFADGVAFPMGAIDPKTGIIYVYEDYYVTEMPISFHAKEVTKRLRNKKLLNPIQADPSVRQRNARDGLSYADYFYKICKVILEPGNNDMMFGIEKVRDYIHSGKLKFFSSCVNLKNEARRYVYVKNKSSNTNEKPIDRYNHLWDAIRYMIARLPRDPNDLNSIYMQRDMTMGSAFNKQFVDDEDDGYESDDTNIYVGVGHI